MSDTPDRQGGEGPAGSSQELPADLIDRAARAAAEWTSWYNGNGWDGLDEAEPEELEKYLDLARGPAEAAVKAVASLLVEHGRRQAFIAVARTREVVTEALLAKGAAQEKTRWETRIENEAELFDARAILNEQGMEQPLPSSSVARLLRSLLTGEGENGE